MNSDLVLNWNRNFSGIPDYSRINTLRNTASTGLDIRVDKKWFFKKWELNLFLDIQNVTANAVGRDVLVLDRPLDEDLRPLGGPIIVNPSAPIDQQRYQLKTINDATGTVLPTLGVIISL